MLTGSTDGTACIWDVKTGKEKTIREDAAAIVFAAFSPYGKRVLTISRSGAAQLCDPADGRNIGEEIWTDWIVDNLEVRSVVKGYRSGSPPCSAFDLRRAWRRLAAFSPDGKRIAVIDDARVTLFSTLDGSFVGCVKAAWAEEHAGSVAFSPDSSRVATTGGLWDDFVEIWDVERDRRLASLDRARFGAGRDATFSPDGHRLLIGGYSPKDASGFPVHTTGVYDAATGQQLLAAPGEPPSRLGYTPSVAFSADGKRFAVGHVGEASTFIYSAEAEDDK